MARRNPSDPAGTGRPARSDTAQPGLWIVPRRWLLAVLLVAVLPSLMTVAAFYARRADNPAGAPPARVDAADAPSAMSTDPRPWGELVVTPIVISPPLEYVPTNWGPIEPPMWRFPQTDRAKLAEFLAWSGLPADRVSSLVAAAREEPRISGLILSPDPAFVRSLDPETRARIYLRLARSPLNPRQYEAYRYAASSPEAWLGTAPLGERTRSLVESLMYRAEGMLFFADIDLVRGDIESAEELQFLAKRLLRSSTMIAELRIDSQAEVAAAAEYWGRGGRRTDIRPLLESVAASSGKSIDISHLLPTFAREHLYRYPRISLGDFDRPSLFNCFWTALNFFNAVPDERFLDVKFAMQRLAADYYIVHDQLQLGDVVAFSDRHGNYFHAAVYLADGLVFGKNGASALSPWTIVPLEHMKGYYVEYAGDWNVTYYRRKDL